MANYKRGSRNYEYLHCPKCGRVLMNHNIIYLDLGNIVMCDECVDYDEFYDCRMTLREFVEQHYLYMKRNK